MHSASFRTHEPDRLDPGSLAAGVAEALAAARSATDPAASVEAALDTLHERVSGMLVSAFVLEYEHLWAISARGYTLYPDGIAPGAGIIGRAIRDLRPQLVLDVGRDPDYYETVGGIVSELALPLLTSAGPVGVLDVETTRVLPTDAVDIFRELGAELARAVGSVRARRPPDLSALARLFVQIASLRDARAIAELAVRSLARIVPLETCQLRVHDDAGAPEELVAWRASSEGPGLLSPEQLAALRNRLHGTAAVELVDLVRTRLPELAGSHARSALLVPLRAGGHEVGVIAGTSRFALALDRSQAESVGLLAGHAAASIDAAVAISHARKSASTDALTGLLNRRGVEEYLERELVSAERAQATVSLLAIDCDDFKELNDRAGHAFGDAVLRELARVLVEALPARAVSGRFGGDEFVVVMRDVPPDRTVVVCEEVVASLVAGLDRSGFPLRVSGGVATFPRDAATATTLMRAADQALYEAKAVGKNCVIGFSELGSARDRVDVSSPRAGGRSVRGEYATAQRLGEAVSAIWEETVCDGVLQRLSRSLTFLVGAAACVVSRVDEDRLVEVARHSLKDVDLGEETSHPISPFPVLQQALAKGGAQSVTLLDLDLDDAEAMRLRGLRMSCCLLAPLRVGGRTWGLVGIYDRRLRRFGEDELEIAEFLVDRAGRRLETLEHGPGMFGPLRTA